MLVEFKDPGERPLAIEADDVSSLQPSSDEPEGATTVILRNGTRHLVAGSYEDVLRDIRAARSK